MAAKHTRILDRALTRLKLRQLRLLIAVSEQGSIQNAARGLGISQPAASKMIQDLEVDFEVKLFERTNRGVVPTLFGEVLIRHGKLIFAQVSNAAQELDDLNEGNSGRVVIGTLLAASPELLPNAVALLLEERPNVAVKIVEGTNDILMPALSAGEIDLVVGRLPSHRHRAETVQEKLYDEQIRAVVGPRHPLCNSKDLQFSDLTHFPWILPPIETTLRRQIDRFFVQNGPYQPETCIESVSYLANRALLQSRDFVCLMPSHVAALDIQQGILCKLDWGPPFGAGSVGVSYRNSNALSPASAAFLSILKRVARDG
ncbi:LysR substrate-binding domain-containing protein [uncultured Shimia sp.]|uniref:LysR substrate-binding domain-containing protein n=1 Tax=uncultured Shimia sp. TaxID=573152 RepID=UPI002600271F|nr:LysR substrate-binding domain-containing protein [uncultured Shimia sp.]